MTTTPKSQPGAGTRRQFIAYFYFVGWDCISLGLHVCLGLPNIEIHIPFGFVRVGWMHNDGRRPINLSAVQWRTFGLVESYDR